MHGLFRFELFVCKVSGYEKSEDYGGREPGPYHWIKVVLLVAVIALVIWGLSEYGEWFERTGGPLGMLQD